MLSDTFFFFFCISYLWCSCHACVVHLIVLCSFFFFPFTSLCTAISMHNYIGRPFTKLGCFSGHCVKPFSGRSVSYRFGLVALFWRATRTVLHNNLFLHASQASCLLVASELCFAICQHQSWLHWPKTSFVNIQLHSCPFMQVGAPHKCRMASLHERGGCTTHCFLCQRL